MLIPENDTKDLKMTMKLTRKELYDLVWTEPMTVIAKRFSLSDNGLRKHCKSMNIPTPPVGYWSKLQYGKIVEQIPLPENYTGKKTSATLTDANKGNDQKIEELLDAAPALLRQQEIELEISKGNLSSFKVPEILYAKEALIIDTREKLREELLPYSERKSPYKSKVKETLDIHAGDKSINRALCIFSTVIKALYFRGHNIQIDKENEYHQKTYAIIVGEKIQIDMKEKRRMKAGAQSSRDTEFCGDLNFNIYGKWEHKIATYKDTAHTRLEDKIIAIIANLEFRSEEIKEERRQAEEQARIAEEKRKIKEVYETRQREELREFKTMFKMAERLKKANILRKYISEYEEFLKVGDKLSEEALEKLEWGKKKADWLDPFVEIEDEYMDDYDKDCVLNSESIKISSYHSSSNEIEKQYPFWAKPYRWFNKKL